MLELRSLRFEQDGFVLNADITVLPRSRVAVIGPSGSGKSTLLSLIAGFAIPDSGRVLWCGSDITDVSPGKRPISVVFQDSNLFPHLDVFTNVALGISPGLRLSEEDTQRVHEVLDRVGLLGFADRRPGELSGGQQGRVALARTLVRGHPIVLLDEPFSALGPALRTEMLQLLISVTEEAGMTVLMVSHDPGDALALGDQTILVNDGLVNAPTATDDLFASPSKELRAYLKA